ncbi:MAG TPA: molybdate ABC transporter substrate-binding protein [Methanospirillum sp.]|jgi:molybdate transport system substrate-binding protein|uniref:molybdate ABC transporter substrate-binding protein n=1 Tax=Methanospirillum sp. TaxID=45200 RepID=UPI0009D42BA5|nr:molybdate ABC transporter substrate-binding protein [Methanospirillum sp.]OQB35347.1 MAG: molybdate ABC transporter periplasmic molybdate-binding protein [Euryarchaeota archaeon ADurb.Bin165]HPY59853.1 molybdate ABC transporter substrate-binding protein [Methanospirillum sp.]HQC00121.1 molybdate ABC transporter substrate-binding protein [Methanospirillum sp.]
MKTAYSCISLGLTFLLLLAMTGAVAAEAQEKEFIVFAAASLTGITGDIGPMFEEAHPGVVVITNLDSSATLETQIKEGAYADLFLPASTKNMNNLLEEGMADEESVTEYATNKLAIIVPADNPASITGLADLANPKVRIVSETAEVPVRKYTEQMLNKTLESEDYGQEFVDAFRANVISEETNVASATAKVALGEADAGITYYSDVTKDLADKIKIIEIPDEFNIVATYVAGILTESAEKELAQEYISLLTSEEGKAVLEEYNFAPAN